MVNESAVTRREREVDGVRVVECRPDDPSEERPHVIMVHGGCHGAWSWHQVQGELATRGWASTAFDWFSHGTSRQLPEVEWLARDVLAVQQEITIVADDVASRTNVPPVVMGHSMGGLASLAYAASGRRQLTALVLLAPVLPDGFADHDIDLPVQASSPWGPPPPDVARQMFYSGVDDVQAEQLYAQLQPESPAAVWQATRNTAQVDVTVSTPTLICAGDEDRLVSVAGVARLAETMGARFVSLPGAGHGLTLDPVLGDVCRIADEWLSELRPGTASV